MDTIRRCAGTGCRIEPYRSGSWHDSTMCGCTASNRAKKAWKLARFNDMREQSVESCHAREASGGIQRRVATRPRILPGADPRWHDSTACGNTASNRAKKAWKLARFDDVQPHAVESRHADWLPGAIFCVVGVYALVLPMRPCHCRALESSRVFSALCRWLRYHGCDHFTRLGGKLSHGFIR